MARQYEDIYCKDLNARIRDIIFDYNSKINNLCCKLNTIKSQVKLSCITCLDNSLVIKNLPNAFALSTDSNGKVEVATNIYNKEEVDNLIQESLIYVTPEMFGAIGDGINNDSVAIQTALASIVSGGILILTKEYYIGNATLNLTGTNITIKAFNKSSLIGLSDIIIRTSGSIENISIDNLAIKSIGLTGSFYGLFTSDNKSINNLKFNNCTFTGVNSITNGIKIINQGVDIAKNISINNCLFIDIGQMGIEFQNHVYDGVYRYEDITINNCKFINLGQNSNYGMAISMSGRGQRFKITNNSVIQAKDIGIELVAGTRQVEITNNIITDLQGTCSPFSFSNGTNSWLHENITVTDNITNSTGRINLYKLSNSLVSNNTFIFTGAVGYVQVNDNTNTIISNNRINTEAVSGIFLAHSAGTFCQNNTICNNDIRTTSTNAGCIQLNGVNTINNTVFSNVLYKGAGGSFVALTNSATASIGINFPNGLLESINTPGIALTNTGQIYNSVDSTYALMAIGNSTASTQFRRNQADAVPALSARLLNVGASIIMDFQGPSGRVSFIDNNGFFDSPSVTTTIDFGNVSANSELAAPSTITLTGAVVGDMVLISSPNTIGIVYKGSVTSLNTITLWACNFTTSPIDPGSGSFKITIIK